MDRTEHIGRLPPVADGQSGKMALQAMMRGKSVFHALRVFQNELGDIFRVDVPGFKATVMAGPDANRFILVTHRQDMQWRIEGDPVVKLLRQGVLVTDNDVHDEIRRLMNPSLHKRMLDAYIPAMVRFTDEILDRWNPGNQLDMLVEMRKIAMLVLVGTLFGDNLTPEMERIFPAMLRTLRYISPGPWLFWRSMPRPGYRAAIQKMDQYLYGLIRKRRALNPKKEDLLSTLIEVSQLNDEFIRDQLLTMLIAGHDTSTALLTWVLYLLGRHSDVFQRVRFEVQSVYGDQAPLTDHSGSMVYLNQVIKETLRLYPPIHAGNRITSTELVFQGYRIPAGSRILYSIYLTHRRPQDWPEPDQFRPERFSVEQERSQRPYTYLPFGGGPRNCIGAAYAQMEARIILVRILQRFSFTLLKPEVHEHMGATLEPRPGVWMQVDRR